MYTETGNMNAYICKVYKSPARTISDEFINGFFNLHLTLFKSCLNDAI